MLQSVVGAKACEGVYIGVKERYCLEVSGKGATQYSVKRLTEHTMVSSALYTTQVWLLHSRRG
jgi:hypothetical protein